MKTDKPPVPGMVKGQDGLWHNMHCEHVTPWGPFQRRPMLCTCGAAQEKKMGRPRLDPTAVRVNKCLRASAITWAKIEAEAKRSGVGVGQVLDRLAQPLPAP